MSVQSTVDGILRLKKFLDEPEVEVETLVTTLTTLAEVKMDRLLLAKSKVSVSVSKLKGHSHMEVRSRARKLIEEWRVIAAIAKSGAAAANQKGAPGAATPTEGASSQAPSEVSQVPDVNISDPTSGGVPPQGVGGAIEFGGSTVASLAEYIGPSSSDAKRDKVRELIYKAFVEGMPADQLSQVDGAQASRAAALIEEALWKHYNEDAVNPKEYQMQFRSIRSNLADKKNPEFNIRIYLGAISPSSLATMPATAMASDAKKRERQKAKKDALEACQSDWDLRNVKRAAGQFPCGKCRSDNTTYFQMQTRSSDEPMTTFVNCLNCGHRWKF